MKIVSYNIMFNDIFRVERVKLLLNLLLSLNADIICLQEVIEPIANVIKINMKDYSFVDMYPDRDYKEIILYKNCRLLYSEPIKLNSEMNRYLTVTTFERVKKFNVITFHLESLEYSITRKEQIETLNRLVKKTLLPTICCGDTNLKKGESGLSELNNDYIDVWRYIGSPENCETSYGDRFFGTDIKERYDRFWIKGFNVANFSILGRKPINNLWISDHDGIMCELY